MKTIIIIFISVAISLTAFGQQDLMVSQYTFNHTFINSAATGTSDSYNASLMYRNQWVQFEGAPVSQFLSVDGPIFSKNMGIGILLQREEIGINTQSEAYASYSYTMDLKKIKISMGLRAGLSVFESNYKEHVATDLGDDLLQENSLSYLPNFGVGIYVKHSKYYAGISIPHILNYDPSTNLKLDIENSNQLVRHYYLMGGYKFIFDDNLTLEPSTLLKYVGNAPPQVDINALAEYNKMIGLGFGYRSDNSVIALVRVRINNNFSLGYSFDFTTSDIRNYSKGSHEVMLSYKFWHKKGSASLIN